jgi:hypothetical protein
MDEQEPVQVVELLISYRYAIAHPWVIQAIGGFLSAYFMEHPGFRVTIWKNWRPASLICEVPPGMKVLRLEATEGGYSPCNAHRSPRTTCAPRYLIDCPE